MSPTVETLLDGHRIGTDQGSIAFCSVSLIEGPDEHGALKRILVDTGHTGRRPALDAALTRRGLSRDAIDVVVCTHAHWDHIENLDIFDRAQVVMHPDERRYVRRPHRNDFACPDWIEAILARYEDRIQLAEEGTRLIPGVEIVAAPGHSAGTIAVTATIDAGIAVIAGDSIQNSLVAMERRNALVFWNEPLARRTIDKLLAVADIVFPGHDRPFRMRHGQAEYIRDFQLTLTGVSAGQPGLEFRPEPVLHQVIMPGIEDQRLPG
jgi:glyoxylase-like metal-dependent hydrolase (beta-lactamase superfamily II)